MMKRLLLVVLCLLLVACTKKETNSIKVGAAGPLTGDLATFGADQLNGMKLTVEEWNAKGGVLGKKILIVEVDDQRDPEQVVSAANKLVNEEVVGIVAISTVTAPYRLRRYTTRGIFRRYPTVAPTPSLPNRGSTTSSGSAGVMISRVRYRQILP